MSHHHDHAPATGLHAVAETPTLSLLRLSAGQRLLGAGVILTALWLALWIVIA
jgi:hypothetical protein